MFSLPLQIYVEVESGAKQPVVFMLGDGHVGAGRDTIGDINQQMCMGDGGGIDGDIDRWGYHGDTINIQK